LIITLICRIERRSLVIYSDGILDAQNSSGEMFQKDRWQDLLISRCHQVFGAALNTSSRVNDFIGEAAQYDDISLLVLNRSKLDRCLEKSFDLCSSDVAFTTAAAFPFLLRENKLGSFTPLGQILEIDGTSCTCYPGSSPKSAYGNPGSRTGDNHLTWYDLEAAQPDCSVCSYDRLGYGWAIALHGSRTADESPVNYTICLNRPIFTQPYVLVCHSFGGLVVRYFAAGTRKQSVVWSHRRTPPSTLLNRQSGSHASLLIPTLTGLAAVLAKRRTAPGADKIGVMSPFRRLSSSSEIKPAEEALYYRPRTLAASANKRLTWPAAPGSPPTPTAT
jgi:hypothetical protein